MFFFGRLLLQVGSPRHGVASCLRDRISCNQYLSIFLMLLPIRTDSYPLFSAEASSAAACRLIQVLPILGGALPNMEVPLHPPGASDLDP